MSGWSQFKTIVEDDQVSAAAEAAKKKWPRFEDAWNGLIWLLARNADDMGVTKMRNGVKFHLYAQEGSTIAPAPRIIVVFSTTDNEVRIHDIQTMDP